MKELINIIYKILFIQIPMPITLFGQPLYYNLFGLIIVFFIIFVCSFIIRKLSGGAGD